MRIWTAVLLLMLLLSSCAATLRVRATAPLEVNDGTCEAPVLYPAAAGAPLVLHLRWSGPASGEDSLTTQAGLTWDFSRGNLPPGAYTVTAWASNLGGAGCDTTITKEVVVRPGVPVVE